MSLKAWEKPLNRCVCASEGCARIITSPHPLTEGVTRCGTCLDKEQEARERLKAAVELKQGFTDPAFQALQSGS